MVLAFTYVIVPKKNLELDKQDVVKLPSQQMTIQTKATQQYFLVVLFIMLYKVVLTFQSVDETLVCDHSNESY